MDKKELTKLLNEGTVNLKYAKSDGSTAERVGTLKSDLCPTSEKYWTVKCTHIEWDTDGEDADLPETVNLKMTETDFDGLSGELFNENISEADEDRTSDLIGGKLTEKFGFTYKQFQYEVIEKTPRKLPESSVFYYDLTKGGYRSFNIDKLISANLIME